MVRPYSEEALRSAKRYGQELRLRGKRHPQVVALAGSAVALTLVGAYALSATGAGRSLCPTVAGQKKPSFQLLMDPVPPSAAGSEIKIRYDVCGLASGTQYSGRVRLSQQKADKKSPKPKALLVTFRDKAAGPATRREQEVRLAPRPGSYNLELSVVDNRGRERKKVQKVLIQAR